MEWQPIDTAPRDGSQFDAWTKPDSFNSVGYRVADVKFGKDDWGGTPCFLEYRRDDDEPFRDRWQDAEEWKELAYWRPLPEPPAAETEDT